MRPRPRGSTAALTVLVTLARTMAAKFAFLHRAAAGPVSLAEGFLHPPLQASRRATCRAGFHGTQLPSADGTQVLAYRARRPDVLRDLHPIPGFRLVLISPAGDAAPA